MSMDSLSARSSQLADAGGSTGESSSTFNKFVSSSAIGSSKSLDNVHSVTKVRAKLHAVRAVSLVHLRDQLSRILDNFSHQS
jgi:hypothetical protein